MAQIDHANRIHLIGIGEPVLVVVVHQGTGLIDQLLERAHASASSPSVGCMTSPRINFSRIAARSLFSRQRWV